MSKSDRRRIFVIGKIRMERCLLSIEQSGKESNNATYVDKGDEYWLVDNPNSLGDRIRHRLDGPAVADKYGQEWSIAGFLHRTDGPAREEYLGHMVYYEWFLYGERVRSFREYQIALECSDEDIIMLTLKYGEMR